MRGENTPAAEVAMATARQNQDVDEIGKVGLGSPVWAHSHPRHAVPESPKCPLANEVSRSKLAEFTDQRSRIGKFWSPEGSVLVPLWCGIAWCALGKDESMHDVIFALAACLPCWVWHWD